MAKEAREVVAALRPIDDALLHKLLEDPRVCEEILRVITGHSELVVEQVVVQDSLKNLVGRSVVLDALCTLADKRKVNIEVQRADNVDHFRRARYHAALVTAYHTPKRVEFSDVADVTVVYITEKDVIKAGRTLYHVKNAVRETGEPVEDGQRFIYVNAEVDDGTKVSELMECFLQTEVDNEHFPRLSEKMKYYKEEEGETEMNKELEEWAREYAQEASERAVAEAMEEKARMFLVNGVSFEVVRDSMQEISPERLKEIMDEVKCAQA